MKVKSRVAGNHDVAPVWVRHRIVLPVGTALVLAALIGGLAFVSAQRSTDNAKSSAQILVRSNRDAAIRALVRETEDFKRAVVSLSKDAPIVNSLSTADAHARKDAAGELSTMARSLDSPAAFLADRKGRNIVVYPDNPDLIGQDFSYRDWFKGVSASDKPYVSEGYRSAAPGRPLVVAIASPVIDGSTRVGYVVVLWQLDSLRSVSEGARRDDGISIRVTDQMGQSLLAPLKVDDRGQPLEPTVSTATKAALAGRSVSSQSGGALREVAPVPALGWTVGASLTTDVALAPAREFRHRQMINVSVALLVLSLLALGASLLARRRAVELASVIGERQRLRVSDERFRRVFDEGLTGKILVDPDGNILRVNGTLARLLGSEAADLLGRSVLTCFADAADRDRVRSVIENGRAEFRDEMAIQGATDDAIWGFVALAWIAEEAGQSVLLIQVEDITARRAAEQRLTDLALLDELTGLPNRRLLVERFDRAFAMARSGRGEHTTVAALFIDLDGFKKVNDWAGHDVGDKLLISVANDVRAILRPSDTIARVGGDEFVVLVEQEEGLDHLTAVANRIIDAVRRDIVAEGLSMTISASVGIARVDLSSEPGVEADQLIRRADSAMYRAKERGRDRYDIFDRSLRASTESRQVLELAVREGLRQDRISLVFQPVVDVDRERVIGAEALMRLTDAHGRLLPTQPAIIAAESASLSEALGDRVLDLALDEACRWPADMAIAVNVSAHELTGRTLRSRVEKALAEHGFDPARLILEITETSILRAGPSALAELEMLRVQGVRVAIDDFGTGYATLQNLITLPVDALKVDTSFTAGLPDKRTHSAIVHGIASMAAALDIPCIIEGVETDRQLEAIRGLGVHAQGWLLAESRGPGHVPEMFSGLPHGPGEVTHDLHR